MIHFTKPIIESEEIEAVKKVLESGMLAEGKVAREFEKGYSEFVGTKFATVTSNGTTALSTALDAMDIQPGDEVITSPFTFIASANSIAMVGAVPVFADIQRDTYNIDPELIEAAITERTKAIMPVHIFGLPSDMKRIMEIAEDHDLLVIEDACQAHGATVDGRQVGSLGHLAAFSFYATKNLLTGEGGMITTDNEEIYEKALSIKNHGRGKQGGYSHYRIGYNNRMMDIVAAIGVVQLKRMPELIEMRRKNAERYDKFFVDYDEIVPQTVPQDMKSGHHLYVPILRSRKFNRDKFVEKLREKGVGSRSVYALPCHKQDTYRNINNWRWAKFIDYPDYSAMSFPNSEDIGSNHFDLPVHPMVTEENMDHIESSIQELLG